MITLKPNANATVNKLCHEDSVIAFYYGVCETYGNGYIQLFITNLQILITKVGIIMSKVSTKHANISYCAQSISYLCNTVLNQPNLVRRFDELGVNEKGNKGKHSVEKNKIDLDKAAATFNELINAISSKYNLPAIRSLILKKKPKTNANPRPNNQESYQSYYNSFFQPAPTPKPNKRPPSRIHSKPEPRIAHTKSSVEDELYVSLDIKLETGNGYYTKGFFEKKEMLNFKLVVNLFKSDQDFKSLTATVKCRNNTSIKKLPIIKEDVLQLMDVDIDLDASKFSGTITVIVTGVYRIGPFKTKQIEASDSMFFRKR